jgi:hypothetical protein
MMKRLSKVWKRIGIGLGLLVAIIVVVNGWFVWTTGRWLDGQLAAIRAEGDPLSIAELARVPIPPERNAETYLRSATAEAAAIDKELWEADGWKDYVCEQTYPIPQKAHQALATVFKAHPKVIPLLEQAAACPDYQAALDYTADTKQFAEQLCSNVMKFRDCARALYYRSQLMVAEGRRDEAVRSALLILPLARHLDRNPLVIDHMVALTLREMTIGAADYAMQTGPISKEVRATLDAELANCERTDSWSLALKNERAFGLDECRHWPGRNVWLIGRPLWNQHCSDLLDTIAAGALLLESDCDYRDESARREKAQASLGSYGRDIFPPLANCRRSSLSMRAVLRSLRVVNALQTHIPKDSGQIPKLSELGLPAETTKDPFNGEPLHVKRLPRGWLVYSVGEDLADDGGKLPPCVLPGCDQGVSPPLPPKSP